VARPAAVSTAAAAGAIVASTDFAAYQDAPDVRSTHPSQIEQLADLTTQALRHPDLSTDPAAYVYLLQALLAFEGVAVWAEHLNGTLNFDEPEYEVPCPHCESDNFVVSAAMDTSARSTACI
jgi:Arc/MetJ family transcription regulator